MKLHHSLESATNHRSSSLNRRSFLALTASALLAAPTGALRPAVTTRRVLRVGKVLRGSEPALLNALITIENGKILSVTGTATAATTPGAPTAAELAQSAQPLGVELIDYSTKVVSAGFIDLLTGVGVNEVPLEPSGHDDESAGRSPIRAAFMAADGYNPASPVIAVTRAQGVTSCGVVPQGGLVSGQSAWADLYGNSASEALVERSLALHVSFDGGDHVSSGMNFLRLRELIADARAFARQQAAYERNQFRKLGASRLDLLSVGRVLDRKIPLVLQLDRASDILVALELVAREGLRGVIASGAEAWKVAPQLAAAKVPVIVNPFTNSPASFNSLGARADNARILADAGVTLALSTQDTHNARKLRQVAGNAVRAGLAHGMAIEAVTRGPARVMGLEGRYGELAAGRVANLVVWSGDPLELSTRVESVFIHGEAVSLRTRQTALLERYRR